MSVNFFQYDTVHQVFIFIWVNTFEHLEHNQEEKKSKYFPYTKYSNTSSLRFESLQ